MSLFIHRENQELLWNIINKTQPFIETFKNSHPNSANDWFRSIIQSYYYENNLHNIHNITPATLNTINRNILSYMISKLKQNTNIYNVNTNIINNNNNNNNNNNFSSLTQNTAQFMETSYSRMQNNKEDNYGNQFAARQKEYETMFAKPTPPVDSKLNDNIKDEVITNMEELIEQHRKQREDELKMVQPPIYSASNSNNNSNNNEQIVQNIPQNIPSQTSSNKVIINEETILEPDNLIEIKQNKSVSWRDEHYINLEKEIHILKQQFADLVMKNKEYDEKIDKLLQTQNNI
jgi:hypothetical protein